MTSWYGNVFHITGLLWPLVTDGLPWQRNSNVRLWCFLWSWTSIWRKFRCWWSDVNDLFIEAYLWTIRGVKHSATRDGGPAEEGLGRWGAHRGRRHLEIERGGCGVEAVVELLAYGWSQREVAVMLKCGDLWSGAPRTNLSYPRKVAYNAICNRYSIRKYTARDLLSLQCIAILHEFSVQKVFLMRSELRQNIKYFLLTQMPWRRRTMDWLSLIQIMVCNLYDAKPLSETTITYH